MKLKSESNLRTGIVTKMRDFLHLRTEKAIRKTHQLLLNKSFKILKQ